MVWKFKAIQLFLSIFDKMLNIRIINSSILCYNISGQVFKQYVSGIYSDLLKHQILRKILTVLFFAIYCVYDKKTRDYNLTSVKIFIFLCWVNNLQKRLLREAFFLKRFDHFIWNIGNLLNFCCILIPNIYISF